GGDVERYFRAEVEPDASGGVPLAHCVTDSAAQLDRFEPPLQAAMERAAAESVTGFRGHRPLIGVVCDVPAVIHWQLHSRIAGGNGCRVREVAVARNQAGEGVRRLLDTVPVDPVRDAPRAKPDLPMVDDGSP